MKVRSTDFRVEGDQVKLDKWPTAVEPIYESKKQYQKLLKKHVEELSPCNSFYMRPVAMLSC